MSNWPTVGLLPGLISQRDTTGAPLFVREAMLCIGVRSPARERIAASAAATIGRQASIRYSNAQRVEQLAMQATAAARSRTACQAMIRS